MTTVITNFTVTNADVGKLRFRWAFTAPAGTTPQKINIGVYTDAGYSNMVCRFSTDPEVSTSGIADFNVADTSFTMGASNPTLANGTQYYSQLYVIPYGMPTDVMTIYVNNVSSGGAGAVPPKITTVNFPTILPANYTTFVDYYYNSIGANFLGGSPTLYMAALIYNFSIYNRILTTAEIANYFKFSASGAGGSGGGGAGAITYTPTFYNPLTIKMSHFYQSVADAPSYLYFDADALNQGQGYFAGSSVASWANLGTEGGAPVNAKGAFTGTANSAAGAYLPVLQQTSAANNNRYYVQFAASGATFTTTGNFFTLPPMQFNFKGYTIIFVANIPTTAGYNHDRIIDFGNGAPGDNILIQRISAQQKLAVAVWNGTTTAAVSDIPTSATVVDGTWRVYAARVDNSYYSWFYNSGVAGAGTRLVDSGAISVTPTSRTLNGANYTTPSSIFGNFIGRSNWTGVGDSYSGMQLGELLMFRTALSDASINSIIAVMEKRWNIDTTRTNVDFEVTQNVATFPIADNSGTAKAIVATGNPAMVNDTTRGYVMSFNGSTHFATVAGTAYNIAASYTKMCWVYLNAVNAANATGGHILSSANTATAGIHYMFYNGIPNLSAGHSSTTTQTIYVTDPQPTPAGMWVHYTVCYENAASAASGYTQYTMTLYRNGVLVSKVTNSAMTWTGGSASTGVAIAGYGGAAGGFNGYVDKPRIYSRALNQSEIQLIFNAEKLNIPPPISYTA